VAREVPKEIVQRLHDIAAGRAVPVEPKQAATVVLLRSGAAGLEAYMLRRKPTMAFAPGAYVFPGGSVDPRDAEGDIGWAGPSPAEWGRIFGVSADLGRELVCAAVRETFEESGVLLAGPEPDTVVADTRDESWEADRRALIDHTLSLAELLDRRGLVLRSDLLGAWAQWITPEVEPRRFDTKFFVAALPTGQRARDVGGEADQVAWLRPADAIASARAREIYLMPPTATTLAELDGHADVDAVLAAAPDRIGTPRVPGFKLVNGTAEFVMPEGVEYPL